MKKIDIVTALLLLLWIGPVNAQPGIPEMQQAKQDLSQSFFSTVDFSLVLAGLFGIIGAIKIYHNWQMGKERITADVAAWFFASLFMVLMGPFVRAIFGL